MKAEIINSIQIVREVSVVKPFSSTPCWKSFTLRYLERSIQLILVSSVVCGSKMSVFSAFTFFRNHVKLIRDDGRK